MLRTLIRLSSCNCKKIPQNISTRTIKISRKLYADDKKADNKVLMVKDPFETIQNRNRKTYLEMVNIFVNRNNVYRSGHVEFIYSALKNMESFGVNKDLEVYKALIDVLPKGNPRLKCCKLC